jgi:hypothetical protein
MLSALATGMVPSLPTNLGAVGAPGRSWDFSGRNGLAGSFIRNHWHPVAPSGVLGYSRLPRVVQLVGLLSGPTAATLGAGGISAEFACVIPLPSLTGRFRVFHTYGNRGKSPQRNGYSVRTTSRSRLWPI